MVERQNDVPPPVKNPDGSTTHHIRSFSEIKKPYQPGDILWVRETIRQYYLEDETGNLDQDNLITEYMADNPKRVMLRDGDGFQVFDKHGFEKEIPWKPSIFMPKVACRIFLKVKEVRAERLQDISDADADAEGVEKYHDTCFYKMYGSKNDWCATPYASYAYLWEMINGVESWNENPWVWVVEFERVEKPENF